MSTKSSIITIVLIVVGCLLLFNPAALGVPPTWRRCLLFVVYIDACLTYCLHRSFNAEKDKPDFWMFFVILMVLSALGYLVIGLPADKLLDMKRERAEKSQRIAQFMGGDRKMPEQMKDFEKDYYGGSGCPWKFESKSIETLEDGGTVVVGNNRFVVSLASGGRLNRLYSLHPKASIAELSSFATYLYDVFLSERIRECASLSREAVALVEFCYQVQIAYIESMSDLVCDAFFKGEKDVLRGRLGGQFPYRCRPEFRWDGNAKELLNMLSFKLQEREIGVAAIRYGGLFSECDPKYIVARMDDIKQNTAADIRDNSYKDSKFPIEKCEEFSAVWRELHIVAYYEAAQQIMRMSNEISTGLLRVRDKPGYDNLHRAVETWRPIASMALKRHCYLFCDFPLVVGTHAAFQGVSSAEGFLKNDRTKASKSAFQLSRMLSEGKLAARLQSNYAANQFVQFHGALKKVMGKKQFESLMTSLKLPAPEVLKVEEIK